ncbi:MAG: glycosyltransferase family 2 protein, partial [Polyangiaceae bacterium]
MNAAVLFLDAPNLRSLRAVPKDVVVLESPAESAARTALGTDATHVLVVEREAFVGPQTFSAIRSLDACGGIVGGCATLPSGAQCFGAAFAVVPFGPYAVEPFPIVGAQNISEADRPASDAIDVVASGVYLVDRRTFIELGGFNSELGAPWRAYDLCMRLRRAHKPVRWDPLLTFGLDGSIVRPSEAVDRRDFMRAWGEHLGARFDLHVTASGFVRRAMRTPLGQREVVTTRVPPVEIVLYGEGPQTASRIHGTTRVPGVRVRDARGDAVCGVDVLREALQTRSERYLALVDASTPLPEGWLEEMLVMLESRPHQAGLRREKRTLLALSRIPLDVQPPPHAASVEDVVEILLARRKPAGQKCSVVYVAHSSLAVQRTSFEAVYGDVELDYHVVVTSSRADSIQFLRSHSTLD